MHLFLIFVSPEWKMKIKLKCNFAKGVFRKLSIHWWDKNGRKWKKNKNPMFLVACRYPLLSFWNHICFRAIFLNYFAFRFHSGAQSVRPFTREILLTDILRRSDHKHSPSYYMMASATELKLFSDEEIKKTFFVPIDRKRAVNNKLIAVRRIKFSQKVVNSEHSLTKCLEKIGW